MSKAAAEEVRKILENCRELAPVALEMVKRAQRLKRSYVESHWGLEGDEPATIAQTADPSQAVVMGRLLSVEYATEKGDDGPSIYRHEFKSPYPVLGYGWQKDGKTGLIVARTNSRYLIDDRGIVG